MDLEIKAPSHIKVAFQGARRTGGGFYETLCPDCAGAHRRRKKTLRAGFLHGKPWWGCMRCECHKEYAAARRTERVRFQYNSEQAAHDERKMREWALKTWERTSIVRPGDPVDRYLREQRKLRPLRDAWPSTLHYGRIKHPQNQRIYDGMVAVVYDERGMFMGIHRTFLLEDGRRADGEDVPEKMRVVEAKLAAAAITGGAIRLGEHDTMLGVAEGIETALAFSMYLELPCWSTISAHGMVEVRIPKQIRHLFIGPDIGDPPDRRGKNQYKGTRSALSLRDRVLREARDDGRELSVRLRPPPVSGKADWNDWAKLQAR